MRPAIALGAIWLYLCGTAYGQPETNLEMLQAIIERHQVDNALRWNQLQSSDYPRVFITRSGQEAYLVGIRDGIPLYEIDLAWPGAASGLSYRTTWGPHETHQIDALHPGGLLGLSLDGTQETIATGEGVQNIHQEYRTDQVTQLGSPVVTHHGTAVAGVFGAQGVATSMGVAPGADVLSFNRYGSPGEIPWMAMLAQDGLGISNHSYGGQIVWSQCPNGDYLWWGPPNQQTNPFFGSYGNITRDLDELAYAAPFLSIVQAAGNSRNEGPGEADLTSGHHHFDPLVGYCNGSLYTDVHYPNADVPSYDTIVERATAKNVITVGAMYGIDGGYSNPEDVVITEYSSAGPTNDGRIKPDLIASAHHADGLSLYVPSIGGNNSYGYLTGTSASAPVVSGTVALLNQLYKQIRGDAMTSAMVKSLLVHSAREAGLPGPDYVHGWGMLDARAAAELLLVDAGEQTRFRPANLPRGSQYSLPVTVTEQGEVKLTLVWTDPPGTSNDVLVDDLDMRLHGPDGSVYQPWVLNPAQPDQAATRGDNVLDNVEQIVIDDAPTGEYLLTVSHKEDLYGPVQFLALSVTGGEFPEALPVELTYFTADVEGQTVFLNWQTATEVNNAGFEIQWLQDRQFEQIGFVEGAGTVTETQTYGFTVRDVPPGVHHFRLKQVDFDGAFEYSPVVEAVVSLPGAVTVESVYPNPFTSSTALSFAVRERQYVSATLYDMLGRVVRTEFEGHMTAGQIKQVMIDGTDLTPGLYVVRLEGETFSATRSVMLQK